jgi:ferric-dicitrate binding protein FerR (iron transport regulator)
MARTDQTARVAPYLQELMDNDYVQENLREGISRLRAAYERAQKRRVEPTRDEKLQEQVRSAAQSITEAARALRNGRRKPEPRWGPRLAAVAGLAVAGGVAALWARERLAGQSADAATDGPGLS